MYQSYQSVPIEEIQTKIDQKPSPEERERAKTKSFVAEELKEGEAYSKRIHSEINFSNLVQQANLRHHLQM